VSALTDYAVARAMLILEGRNSATRIARELGVHREAVSYWLNRMRENGHAERDRRRGSGGGYEWWLTQRGQAFAIYTRPDDGAVRTARGAPHYDHRALAGALGMNRNVTPPLGRVHRLEGGR
jgi:predicted ArsR family transcriptional regulator